VWACARASPWITEVATRPWRPRGTSVAVPRRRQATRVARGRRRGPCRKQRDGYAYGFLRWAHRRRPTHAGQHKGGTVRRRWCSPFGLVEDRGGAVASRCRGGSRPCSAARGRRCRGSGRRRGAGVAAAASSSACLALEQRRPPLLAFPRGSSFFSGSPLLLLPVLHSRLSLLWCGGSGAEVKRTPGRLGFERRQPRVLIARS